MWKRRNGRGGKVREREGRLLEGRKVREMEGRLLKGMRRVVYGENGDYNGGNGGFNSLITVYVLK